MAPQNKLLAKMPDGRPMIVHTVAHVVGSAANPVIVVTGHQRDEIRAALAGFQLDFAHTDEFASGMATSLRAGIAALPAEVDAALICLGDMPLVTPELLDKLIAAFNPHEGREIIVPVCGGERGNPLLWSRRFFPELSALTGDIGGRNLLVKYKNFFEELEIHSNHVLRDFDTMADFRELFPDFDR
jgi:molybdenum cofactor cytidylyltransferase